jgi:hypothetical protein
MHNTQLPGNPAVDADGDDVIYSAKVEDVAKEAEEQNSPRTCSVFPFSLEDHLIRDWNNTPPWIRFESSSEKTFLGL